LNRYYGVFEDGRIKMRGIEARRGDTPPFIEKAQIDMIKVLAKASNYEEFLERVPLALGVLKEYADKLISKNVDIEELLIAKRLSKRPSDYTHDVFQALAARQLMTACFDVYPGQTVQYLITDSKSKRINERVLAKQLIKAKVNYDVEKYLELLVSAAETLLGIFSYNSEKIRDLIFYREKQLMLS
jgi:DNA polymerase-2